MIDGFDGTTPTRRNLEQEEVETMADNEPTAATIESQTVTATQGELPKSTLSQILSNVAGDFIGDRDIMGASIDLTNMKVETFKEIIAMEKFQSDGDGPATVKELMEAVSAAIDAAFVDSITVLEDQFDEDDETQD